MSDDHVSAPRDLANDVHEETAAPLAYELDPDRYLAELSDLEITDAQKIEFLETLWSIMRSFVELGFDVKICEQLFIDSEEFPTDANGGVKSPISTSMEKPLGR